MAVGDGGGDPGGDGGGEGAGDGKDVAEFGPYEERALELRDRAVADNDAFDPPTNPPAEDRALEFARDGVGDAIAVYIEARTEDSWVYFDADAFDALETALNTYLDCFAACYGVERDSAVTIRTAAETLLETHDAVDTAAVLTDVDA